MKLLVWLGFAKLPSDLAAGAGELLKRHTSGVNLLDWPVQPSLWCFRANADSCPVGKQPTRGQSWPTRSESGEGWPDEKIAKALDTNVAMVERVRAKLVEEGLDAVLTRKKRETPPIAPIFDGERQAQLIALACSQPPEGFARWTIRLLAEHVVERQIVPAAHHNTVGRALKKTRSSRT